MNRKPVLIIGIIILTFIFGTFILFSTSKETCISLVNQTNSTVILEFCCIDEVDTIKIDILPRKEICIGNWEEFFGKIQNNGLSEIKNRYKYLKIITQESNIKNLLHENPEYKALGSENHYLYSVK